MEKALALLSLFESHPELSLTEVSNLSGLPKATAHRLLRALERAGLVQQRADRRYRLGLRLLRLASTVAERLEVREVALPHMRWLRDRTGQSVQLVVVDGYEGVYVERVEGTAPVRLYIALGRRGPLYAGASTRLLLAYLSPEQQEAILARNPPQRHTPNTITDLGRLREVLRETREKGWTISYGELQEGSAEMAAPIWNHRGEVVAALSIAGADSQYTPAHLEQYLPLLRQASLAISRELGYHPALQEANG
ncbi:IclR family transcriptional regulator [Caldinitratiruptor microaerophilus]|uniref:Glycerol operon regulatory protein n=1 Tax=Caldinitratiruptor microaerophilus TaxID=671077 RepID=A0AA35CND1_9FIRM|nr:IclR family transcriptional regulator [Caldinitratiruptor microaerophilus]BDG62372.1 IclR family transcriptional regulator [Caldinitratiruptor microaerophilus]